MEQCLYGREPSGSGELKAVRAVRAARRIAMVDVMVMWNVSF